MSALTKGPQLIADDDLADRAIELFRQRYEPLLYAADLGLTYEEVMEQIRWTLCLYMNKAEEAQQRLSRRGKAGRKPIGERPMTNAEYLRRSRAKKKGKK